MNLFGDNEAVRIQDAREWRRYAAGAYLPGLNPDTMAPGALFTVSPNLSHRSTHRCDVIWRFVAANQTHVLAEATTGYEAGKGPVLLLRDERHFYDATVFAPVTEEA